MTGAQSERDLPVMDRSRMRALSLWQPWASLIAVGAKTIETRSWGTKYRGPLAIHAAKTLEGISMVNAGRMCREDDAAIAAALSAHGVTVWGDLPLGAVVAVADLVDCVPIHHEDHKLTVAWERHIAPTRDGSLWLWEGPGDTENLSTGRPPWRRTNIDDQRPFGDYAPGRFGWVLDNVRVIEPVPARGRQQLFEVDLSDVRPSDDSTATSKDGSHGRAGASRGSETGGAGGEGEGTGTRPARGNDGPSPQGVADALEGTGRPAPLIGGVAPPAPDSDEPDVRGDSIESDRTNGGER